MQLYVRNTSKAQRSFSRVLSNRLPRLRPAVECAQCGEAIYIPEWSEWLDSGHARHLWQCDSCGYSFETTVHFAAA